MTFALPRRKQRRVRSAAEQQRRRWFRQTVLGILTLALTPIPIVYYMMHTQDGYLMYLKARYSLMPPSTPQLPQGQYAIAVADKKLPTYGVPVLVYHGIGLDATDTADSRFVVSRTAFAQQMRGLEAAGYHAITTAQLSQYLQNGNMSLLPSRPVLITFDDGREDAMLQADPILKDTGMKATMFVIGTDPGESSFYYADWGALSGYSADGHWELGNHTYDLHRIVTVHGKPESVLVQLQPGESIAAYKQRVGADLDHDEAVIDDNSPSHPIAFAYPYGDWGQNAAPGVSAALQQVLKARFKLAFDQDDQRGWRPAMPGDDPMHIHRLQARNWNGAQLVERLRASMKLGRTTYEQRGLNIQFTQNQLVAAAAKMTCSSAPIGAAVQHGPTGEKQVALTFDGGPSAYTAQVLDVLHVHNTKATFFVNGVQLHGDNRLLDRMVLEGDEIGNGSWNGTALNAADASAVSDSISRTQRAIESAAPITPCYTRPPYGLDRARYTRIAKQLGLGTALWSVDPSDFRTQDSQKIAERVLKNVKPGSIVVLHDGGGSRWATVQALPQIVNTLRKQGYVFRTVSQLVASQTSPQ